MEETEDTKELEVKDSDKSLDISEAESEKISEENESIKDEVNEQTDEETKKGKDNIIFVGIKPFMNYVTGVTMQFQNKGQDEVIVSARGKFISKAVDVVEVARRTFLKDENIKIESINISSEQFENKEGRRIFVSAIEIKLSKN